MMALIHEPHAGKWIEAGNLRLLASTALLVALVALMGAAVPSAFAGRQDNEQGCFTSVQLPTKREVTTCAGNVRAWDSTTEGYFSVIRIRRTIYPMEEAYFGAIIGSINYDTKINSELYSLADVIASGFNGYFSISWFNTMPAHSLTIVNGSQYQSYTDNPNFYLPPSQAYCNRKVDGSGECGGTFFAFQQHSSPDTFVQFSKSISLCTTACIVRFFENYKFEAQIGSDHYSCVPVDSRLKEFWMRALVQETSFWVDWNAAGECTMLYLDHGSFDYMFRAMH
jgi:hypothetical protein